MRPEEFQRDDSDRPICNYCANTRNWRKKNRKKGATDEEDRHPPRPGGGEGVLLSLLPRLRKFREEGGLRLRPQDREAEVAPPKLLNHRREDAEPTALRLDGLAQAKNDPDRKV